MLIYKDLLTSMDDWGRLGTVSIWGTPSPPYLWVQGTHRGETIKKYPCVPLAVKTPEYARSADNVSARLRAHDSLQPRDAGRCRMVTTSCSR